MKTLSKLDYKIISFISTHEPASKKDIKNRFKRVNTIDYRLKRLSRHDTCGTMFIANTSIIEPQQHSIENGKMEYDNYVVTEKGKTMLQDYLQFTKIERFNLWLKNAWIPIIVSFVTTCISIHIVPKLPLIIKWFAHTLSRIFS